MYPGGQACVTDDQRISPTIVPNRELSDQIGMVDSQMVVTSVQNQTPRQRRTDTTESFGDGELCFVAQLPFL